VSNAPEIAAIFRPNRSILLGLIVPIIFLIVWEMSLRFALVPSTLIASPAETFEALVGMIKDGSLFANSYISCQRLLFGFGNGCVIGIMLGCLIGTSRIASWLLQPTIAVVAPVPAVAWVPLIVMLLGIGEASKIALIAFGTFFVVALHTANGIRSTDQQYVELANVLGKSQAELLAKVLFPSALPHVFTGMRVAMALSWTLLLVSEIIASSEGLGWLIWDARNFSRPADMFVGMIAVGVLGRLSDLALVSVERIFTDWRSTYDTWQDNVERSDYRY
jgi:ABC-type nitrate/sulfonate/bicarbonate transport system permease component